MMIFLKEYNLHLFICLLFAVSCSTAGNAVSPSPETVLVGSTPGGASIQSMLSIDPTKKVDFTRWQISLNEGGKSFVLNAAYGVGKPNTPDFEGGGETLSLEGSYILSKANGFDVYKLTNGQLPGPISVAKLNEDTFHLLSTENRLMVGNGGWSYTLSRKGGFLARSAILPLLLTTVTKSTAEDVYDGRTPCAEIAREYKWPVGNECYKLKWKLTLFRDPKTGQPTRYNLQRTLHRAEPIEGKWTIVDVGKNVVYRLDPDKPDVSISFLVADENVLFFLDKENRLFGGNADFSYTLNRRTN